MTETLREEWTRRLQDPGDPENMHADLILRLIDAASATRAVAMEEAARVAEARAPGTNTTTDEEVSWAVRSVANTLRALAPLPPPLVVLPRSALVEAIVALKSIGFLRHQQAAALALLEEAAK